MADKKISQLTAATTPLAGTEVVPVVQSGVTKKVPVADLTAGRAISATEATLTTGNLIIGTSGKGIDFSATASGSGTMTSELLADYEEGTWTPTVTSQSGTITSYTSSGTYTKIGREVFVNFTVLITNAGTGSGGLIVSLPYTVGQDTTGVARERALTGTLCQCTSDSGATSTTLFTYSNLSPVVTNYNLTGSLAFTV